MEGPPRECKAFFFFLYKKYQSLDRRTLETPIASNPSTTGLKPKVRTSRTLREKEKMFTREKRLSPEPSLIIV